MKKQIKLQDNKVDYKLRRSRRVRRLRLAVYCDGSFVVTAPNWLSLNRIENFIFEKAQWVLKRLKITRTRPRNLVFVTQSKREYKKLKAQALEIATRKVEEFNRIYNLSYNKITIRNQKTRWGSCSQKGNLNYNYKIALLPDELADYIVVHELCHLKEFNHSRNFWALVGQTIPDYKERKKKIRRL